VSKGVWRANEGGTVMSVTASVIKAGGTLSTIDGKLSIQFDSNARVIQSNEQSYRSVGLFTLGEGEIKSWVPLRIENNPWVEPQIMKWEISVGADRIVIWSSQSSGFFAGPKEVPGKATAGFYMFDSLTCVTCDTRSENGTLNLSFYARVDGKDVLCAIEGTKKQLFTLAKYFTESFANYYAAAMDSNSLAILSGLVSRLDPEKSFANPFLSISISGYSEKITLTAEESDEHGSVQEMEQQASQATKQQIDQQSLEGKSPSSTQMTEQSNTADLLMRKRQELHELKNAIELDKDSGKNGMMIALFYGALAIGLLILAMMNPSAWYYWLIAIGLIIWRFRQFNKAKEVRAQAKYYEQMIPSLEREIQELEKKEGK